MYTSGATLIDVLSYQQKLVAMLEQYGLPASSLEIDPDVQGWCRQKQVHEDHAFRVAKCFWNTDTCHIVMRAEISPSLVCSAKAHMELNGLNAEVAGQKRPQN